MKAAQVRRQRLLRRPQRAAPPLAEKHRPPQLRPPQLPADPPRTPLEPVKLRQARSRSQSLPRRCLPRLLLPTRQKKLFVLLVIHPGGIDDRIVKQAVQKLKALRSAPYRDPRQADRPLYRGDGWRRSRSGAGAVVVRPRRLSGGTPQASVSYGFQTAQSVVQAVRDASTRVPKSPTTRIDLVE